MSKALKEMRTHLTQFLYGYYEELLRTYPQEEAKELTYKTASELLEPFVSSQVGSLSYSSLLKDWKKTWEQREQTAIKTRNWDLKDETSDALLALQVLIPLAEKEDKSAKEDNKNDGELRK